MIKEFDKVKILSTGETGIVVDIRKTDMQYYLVELNNNVIVDCTVGEIESIN